MMWASDLFLCLVVPNQQKRSRPVRTLRYNVSFMIPTSACQFIDYMQCCKANSTSA